ncbi:MAG TPA: serine/threonine-protein kinase [Ktedonobacterales bacterium]|jgi:serine/threonine protein kinase
MEPANIGRYRVIKKLGKGGMGIVLQAYDDMLKRNVAIKLPNETEPEDLSRLQEECKVLTRLQHHHIVEVFGSGSEPETPFYLVMEYVEGVTVEELLRQEGGRLDARRALKIALGVAEALAFAHRPPLRVIHRDIKPGNVLIRQSDQQVKLADFGLAAVLAERSGKTAIGTLAYMSPEQAAGRGADERSDLYSLGTLLYEMLTGQYPPRFALDPALPPSAVPGVTFPLAIRERLDWLVLGLLHRDPNQRVLQRAEEVATELQALLEGQPQRVSSARPARSSEQFFPPPTWAEPASKDSWHPPQWQPRQLPVPFGGSKGFAPDKANPSLNISCSVGLSFSAFCVGVFGWIYVLVLPPSDGTALIVEIGAVICAIGALMFAASAPEKDRLRLYVWGWLALGLAVLGLLLYPFGPLA